MDLCRRTAGFLLLVQLNLCSNIKRVILEKRIGSETDVTPICTDDVDNFIAVLICRIKKSNGVASCRLRYLHGNDFENDCGPGIELVAQNRTVFLHLKDLTPEDNGLYECECINTDIVWLQLNVTVEEVAPANDREKNTKPVSVVLICSSVFLFIVISGVIVALIYKRRCCRQQTQPPEHDGEETDTYAELQEQNNDLYQTINNVNPVAGSGSRHQPSLREYENINYKEK